MPPSSNLPSNIIFAPCQKTTTTKNDNKTSFGLFCFCLLCFQVVFRNNDYQAVKDYIISQQSSCGQCPAARCALQRQPVAQLYHLSHCRFKSQTKQRRSTEKSLSLRESWQYEWRYGTVGLAQSVWHSRYGTVSLAQSVWHSRYGTVSLAQSVWHSQSDTVGMAQSVWRCKHRGVKSLKPANLEGHGNKERPEREKGIHRIT